MASSECAVCLLPFDLDSHLPQILRCAHTFCKGCVDTLSGETTFKCPTCCRECLRSDVNTNLALTDILQAKCEGCSDREKAHKCHHCGQGLCDSCLENHLLKYHAEIRGGLDSLKHQMKDSFVTSVDTTVVGEQREKEEEAVAAVTQTADTLRQMVTDFENQLKETIRDLTKKNIDRHLDWTTQLADTTSKVRIFINSAENDLGKGRRQTAQDAMKEIDDQRRAMSAELAELSNNPPRMTEFRFQPTDQLAEPNIGDVVVCPTDRPQAASAEEETRQQPDVDYSAIVLKSMAGKNGSDPEDFDSPMFVACSDDVIYVTDHHNHRVKMYDQNVKFISAFGSKGDGLEEFNRPTGITIGRKGELFVADAMNCRVMVYDKQGQIITTFGSPGDGPGEFCAPYGLATGPGGDLYICDMGNYRVQVVRPDGTYVRTIGGEGQNTGQFKDHVSDVTVTDTKVIVTEDDNTNIHVFSLTGEYLTTWPKRLPTNLAEAFPSGVCTDKHQNVLVSYDSGCVVVLSSEGEYLQTIGSPGEQPGQLEGPVGVTVSGRGRWWCVIGAMTGFRCIGSRNHIENSHSKLPTFETCVLYREKEISQTFNF